MWIRFHGFLIAFIHAPQDGQLDADEFALSMHLINIKLDGFDLPDDLPHHLVPPSKKKVYNGNGAGSASGSDESY